MDQWDSIIDKLRAIPANMREATKVAVIRSQNRIKANAKQLAPVGETGQLHNDIHSRPIVDTGYEIYGDVGTTVEYAIYQEMGTGQRGAASPSPPKSPQDVSYREDWMGVPAQPFLYPSLKAEEPIFREEVAGLIRGSLNG